MGKTRLFAATSNAGKVREFVLAGAELSGYEIAPLPNFRELPTVEETGETFEANARIKAMQELNPEYQVTQDPVPQIGRKHFEEALKNARRSVTATDLDRFEAFRRKFDPQYASASQGSGGVRFDWPGGNAGQPGAPAPNRGNMFNRNQPNNDDDIYS